MKTIILAITLLVIRALNTQAQIVLSSLDSPKTENFNTIGSSDAATLPSGWRVSSQTEFSSGTTQTTQSAGTTGSGKLYSGSTGGTYNFANGINSTSTDRAVGFLSSESYSSTRNLFVQLQNNTAALITTLSISYDIEKYRSGKRAFTIGFYSSSDGLIWTSHSDVLQSYASDSGNSTVFDPPSSISKNITISGVSIADGANFYLRWAYTGEGGNSNGQGLGIDNFSITAVPEPSEYALVMGLGLLGFALGRRYLLKAA
jgi:hypothetical protein